MGRDDAVNVETTRKHIYPRSMREQITPLNYKKDVLHQLPENSALYVFNYLLGTLVDAFYIWSTFYPLYVLSQKSVDLRSLIFYYFIAKIYRVYSCI